MRITYIIISWKSMIYITCSKVTHNKEPVNVTKIK